jgi:IclR family pca regulon transcriptional regulator
VTATRRASDFVRSLERGLAVIGVLPFGEQALTASDVATEAGLTRAAARRFLLTLADLGYVRTDGRTFRLAPRVLELTAAYLSGLALPDVALPHSRALVEEVRESSSLAVLDGDEVVYVAHTPADRVLSIVATVGGRDPAFATALGRVLLAAQDDAWLDAYLQRVELKAYTERTIVDPKELRAELEIVRAQGWALVDEELEAGLRALSVPIRDREGRVVAACNLGLHASRWEVDVITSVLLTRLQEASSAVEAALAVTRPVDRERGSPPRSADREEAPARSTDFVQSLERGLAVIRAFGGSMSALTLSEVAAQTKLTRAAARRFLLTLADLGYVSTDGRGFRLTPKVLDLGRGYLARATLPDVLQPHLRDLAGRVKESTSVAVLEGHEIVYIAEASTPRILAVIVPLGGRDPAWATSLGRVLLAARDDGWLDDYLATVELTQFTARSIRSTARLRSELVRVRKRGYAIVDEEFEKGLRAVAVPIHDVTGRVVAAVNVAVHTSRWEVEEIEASLVPELRAAAEAIDRDLGTFHSTFTS